MLVSRLRERNGYGGLFEGPLAWKEAGQSEFFVNQYSVLPPPIPGCVVGNPSHLNVFELLSVRVSSSPLSMVPSTATAPVDLRASTALDDRA